MHYQLGPHTSPYDHDPRFHLLDPYNDGGGEYPLSLAGPGLEGQQNALYTENYNYEQRPDSIRNDIALVNNYDPKWLGCPTTWKDSTPETGCVIGNWPERLSMFPEQYEDLMFKRRLQSAAGTDPYLYFNNRQALTQYLSNDLDSRTRDRWTKKIVNSNDVSCKLQKEHGPPAWTSF
jgi:hypothetical protein